MINFVSTVTNHSNPRSDDVNTAKTLVSSMDQIDASADRSLKPDLDKFYAPAADLVSLSASGGTYVVHGAEWKAAATSVLGRCSPGSSATAPTPTPASSIADTLSAKFPGFPLIVDVSTIDYRVANWYSGKLSNGRVVALIPGVYTPYNPNVPDLKSYYTGGSADGDTMMKDTYLPSLAGAGWSGVQAGTQEPK